MVMTTVRVIRALLIWACLAFPVLTAEAEGLRNPSADEVIERYIHAIGGRDALERVRTMEILATYEEPQYELVTPTRILKKRPDFRVVELPEIGIAEGYDGASWEYRRSGDEIVRTGGAAEAATRRGAEFDESVVDWKLKGHSVSLVGSSEVFDSETWEVRVTLADGWEKTYFFDKGSFLIVARKKAMPIHARGEDVETISKITEYRTVKNIRMPFVEAEYRTDNGTLLNRLVISRVRINVPLADEVFTPGSARERLMDSSDQLPN